MDYSENGYMHLEVLRQVIEENPLVGVWHADPSGRVTYANPRLLAMGGYRFEEVAGRELAEFVRLAPGQTVAQRLEEAARHRGRDVRIVEVQLLTKDGGDLTVLAAPMALREPRGELAGYAGSTVDISQQKELERQLQLKVEELEESNACLARASSEFEAFAWSIAHDLRAPIETIAGTLRRLQSVVPAEHEEEAGRAATTASQVEQLVNELLTYSRLGRATTQVIPLTLEEVVDEAVTHMRAELERREARIEVARPMPQAMGDHGQLVQAVTNLIANACKFVSADLTPRIRVHAGQRGDWVRLSVTDNGIGIDPEHQSRIFRLFDRLHGTDLYPGSGMGLAIVQRCVSGQGGRVGVDSGPDQGSTFWIDLPNVD